MEDFDSLNEKQLESLERGLSDLKNNRVMTSDEFWKELLSKKEQQELLDEAYENYKKEILRQRQLQKEEVNRLRSQGKRLKVSLIELLTKEEFINKCKTDTEFSENWGLKIEERELSLDERVHIFNSKMIKEEIRTQIATIGIDKSYWKKSLEVTKHNIPTRAVTIKYNDKTIESYE